MTCGVPHAIGSPARGQLEGRSKNPGGLAGEKKCQPNRREVVALLGKPKKWLREGGCLLYHEYVNMNSKIRNIYYAYINIYIYV